MKPLTIDELKSLEVGDWVWCVDLARERHSAYVQKDTKSADKFNQLSWTLIYSDYGKTWLAYKNKEQAECKGEIVELPCKTVYTIVNKSDPAHAFVVPKDINLLAIYEVKRLKEYGYFADKPEADRRLAELKGEKI